MRTLYLLRDHELVFCVHVIAILWPQFQFLFDHVKSGAPYLSVCLWLHDSASPRLPRPATNNNLVHTFSQLPFSRLFSSTVPLRWFCSSESASVTVRPTAPDCAQPGRGTCCCRNWYGKSMKCPEGSSQETSLFVNAPVVAVVVVSASSVPEGPFQLFWGLFFPGQPSCSSRPAAQHVQHNCRLFSHFQRTNDSSSYHGGRCADAGGPSSLKTNRTVPSGRSMSHRLTPPCLCGAPAVTSRNGQTSG